MNSTAQLSTAPEITVNRFRLSGAQSLSGEYANETQVITVEVENTGNEYLKDIVVSCEIFLDPGLTSLAADLGQNQTVSLEVGEIMEFEFWSWTPNVADPMIATSFWVNITATGTGFMDMMNTDAYPATEVVIREITIIDWVPNTIYDTMGTIMTPRPYVEEMMPNVETYNYSAAVHTGQFNIINLGNVEATNVVVDVDGYDVATSWDSVFNDQETVVSLMPWTSTDWTDFSSNTWDLTALLSCQLNLSVSSGADILPPNATHYFEVNDYYDVKPMMLTTDLVEKFGTTIFNTTATHDFKVQIFNNGNQVINTDFWARLNATNWAGQEPEGWEYDFGYKKIDGATTNLNPGDSSQETWIGINPPGTGIYQFNVTAPGKDPTNLPGPEQNTTNNMTSIILTFMDTEGINIDMITPSKNSKWPVMAMDINASITNTGTIDFADLGGCEVSLMIYDNNDTIIDTSDDLLLWNPANVTIHSLGMTMTDSTSAKWIWTGAVGGEEYLVVVNASIGTTTVGQSVTITFPHPNGTVVGMITTPANTAGIEIKAWDGVTFIKSTTTDATGFYQMSLEAIQGFYNITVRAPYGYYDTYNDSVLIFDDGRITAVNFDLYPPPVGTVNGTITLVEVGMPDPGLDYTRIEVAVEGTPLWVNADADGNYSLPDIVPGIMNVTATMWDFTSAWNDSVKVVAGEVTENVNFTLVEDWEVMVDPPHESIMVPVDTIITVTFEEEINITSVNIPNTFEVEDDTGTTIDGVIEWAVGNMRFTFTPDADLDTDTEYSIWLSTDITNFTDVMVLHRDWESTFYTEWWNHTYWIKGYVTDAWNGDPIEGATVTAGTAAAPTDATGAYTLSIGAGIYDVTASKPLYEDDTVTGVYVVAAVATENINLTLTPIVNLDVMVMVGDVETEIEPDGAILADVDIDTVVMMEFEEAINATDLGFFFLEDSVATGLTGFVAWDAMDMTVTFTPEENLTEGETYTLTIMDTVENENGAPILPRDMTWQFITYYHNGCFPIRITPADGATDVTIDAMVEIDFGCEMNITATEAAITAAFGTGFTWDMYNQTVIIGHDNFAYNTEYTVSVSGTAQSIEGYYSLPSSSTFITLSPSKEDHKQDLVVIDENGSGIADVVVTIQDEDGNTVWVGSTDSNGSLIIILASDLNAGNYTIYLQKDGYKDLIFTIEVNETGHILLPKEPVSMGPDDTPLPEEGKTDDDETFVNYVLIIGIIITIVIIVIILGLAFMLKTSAKTSETPSELRADELRCGNCGAIISDLTYCQYCGWSRETWAEPPEKLEEESGIDEEE